MSEKNHYLSIHSLAHEAGENSVLPPLAIPLSPTYSDFTPQVLINSIDTFTNQILTLGIDKSNPQEDEKLVARCAATRGKISELAGQLFDRKISVRDYWHRTVVIGSHSVPFASAQSDVLALMVHTVSDGTKYGVVRTGERGRDNLMAYLASTLCLMKLHLRAASADNG